MQSPFKHFFTRRAVLKGVAAVPATAILTGCANASKSGATKLAIVYTNDTHGHDILDDESMGLAAVKQLKKDYEAKGYEVLMLDAGDFVQGDNLVNHSNGTTGVDFFNECGYDAVALGNHEFDYGQNAVYGFVETAHFPILSANIIVDATGQQLFAPRTTFTLTDGTKVGVFGVTTPETSTSCNPTFVKGLTFQQGDALYACAQEQVNHLRSEGCSLVVCLAHLGESETEAPSRAQDLVKNTVGIDLVIDGHDHEEENQTLQNGMGKDVLVVETGCYTHAVGVITWENGTLTAGLERFGEYTGQDAEVAKYVKSVSDSMQDQLSTVMAHTNFVLDGSRAPGLRTHETNLGDLVCDAVLWEARQMADDTPDCVITNGGAIRDGIEAGDITEGDVLNVLPFVNYVCTIKVTGAQLLEAIEASCAVTPEEMGGFPQVSAMTYSVDTRVPFESAGDYPGSTFAKPAKPGARVTISDVGGRGFSLDDTYTVASNDFLCAGGDSYYVFAEAASKTMKDINYKYDQCLSYFLKEACNGEVPDEYKDPAGQGRITVIE